MTTVLKILHVDSRREASAYDFVAMSLSARFGPQACRFEPRNCLALGLLVASRE